ncbi:MAG: acyl-CoA synthetase FdrA [Candidatus Hodarchaeaceae archaeon]|nr:acyl-CoA synthetase FdrA [Candidatus Hodarchaeaceae archaeon]
MVIRSRVYKGEYRDSIFLMRISQQLGSLDGVRQASALMATDANKCLLREAGTLTDEVERAGPNDLAIVVDTVSPERAEEVISKAREMMVEAAKELAEKVEVIYRTLDAAAEARPDSNLVLVSVPGAFAAREAERALELGKHVMIFSDGVPLENEVRLKRIGRERGLLVMGPDCGTSIINGIGLGFADVVNRGPIGIVAAAGTGAQAVSSLISAGPGVSHVIGTGSRDLHDEVGGITMLMGIQYLADDPGTQTIVLISKPPAPTVSKKVLDAAKQVGKPIVVCFLGGDPKIIEEAGLIPATTLEDAAVKAMAVQRGEKPKSMIFSASFDEVRKTAEEEYSRLEPGQRYIRGIYSGGTFCNEAMLIVRDLIGDAYSNIPLKPELKLEDSNRSREHTFVDYGEDEFTAKIGKPHPMIYHELRQKRMLAEASDPETAVILLDIVLGHGADMDPAGALAKTIIRAKKIAEEGGRYLSVVASVCGTPQDPQDLTSQEEKLRGAGAVVMPSNAQAARMTALIATRGKVWERMVEEKL